MPSLVKTILLYLVAGFLLYAILTSPVQAANTVSTVWGAAKGSVVNLGQFFNALMG